MRRDWYWSHVVMIWFCELKSDSRAFVNASALVLIEPMREEPVGGLVRSSWAEWTRLIDVKTLSRWSSKLICANSIARIELRSC